MDNGNEGEVHEEPHKDGAQPDSRTLSNAKRRKRRVRHHCQWQAGVRFDRESTGDSHPETGLV